MRKEGAVAMELPADPLEQAKTLAQFAGLWIAVMEDAVVATEPTIDRLYKTLDDRGLSNATVFRVPDPKQGVFVG